ALQVKEHRSQIGIADRTLVQFQRLLQYGNAFLKLSKIEIGNAQILVARNIVRLELDDLLKCLQCVVILVKFQSRTAQSVVVEPVIGIQLNGAIVGGERFGRVAGGLESIAET